jgi:hypothetical protein
MTVERLAAGCVVLATATVMTVATAVAQGRGAAPPRSPRAGAPVDLTGYWVSLVTEDWRFRMFTPPRGDFTAVPLNPEGRRVAQAWDPARDAASGELCKAYGAGGIMRMPGRLRITWVDDTTLKVEMDAGTQTRTLRFGAPQGPGRDWQGVSAASWDRSPTAMESQSPAGEGQSSGGSLKVTTTKMRPGYLRRNGVPYSGDAVITEYYDRFDIPSGDSLLVVATEVVDPTYLLQPFWTSAHFKKQRDGSGWNPTPCSVK